MTNIEYVNFVLFSHEPNTVTLVPAVKNRKNRIWGLFISCDHEIQHKESQS
jgi:hypothetical protein